MALVRPPSGWPSSSPYISKAELRHSPEETHFSRLYPRSRSFGYNPDLVTIGEGWNKDEPVN